MNHYDWVFTLPKEYQEIAIRFWDEFGRPRLSFKSMILVLLDKSRTIKEYKESFEIIFSNFSIGKDLDVCGESFVEITWASYQRGFDFAIEYVNTNE